MNYIYLERPNELLIDDDVNLFDRLGGIARARVVVKVFNAHILKSERYISKNFDRDGNMHVALTLNKKLSQSERTALKVILGDDRIKAAYDLIRSVREIKSLVISPEKWKKWRSPDSICSCPRKSNPCKHHLALQPRIHKIRFA